MKALTIAVAVTALLASGLIFADDPQGLTHVEQQLREAAQVALADPASFADDICWTSPDWQDS